MSEKNTPKEILSIRFNAFRSADPKKIYTLYGEESDFLCFFPTAECYALQYQKLAMEIELSAMIVLSETIHEDSAEVEYEEQFKKDGEMIKQLRKAFLIKERGEWKIVTENLIC